jgi:two-component system LytT family response regulator
MQSAIILDDEINGAESLGILIREYCMDVKILSVETDPARALKAVRQLRPTLLFLDIEMPGISGFEFLNQLENPLPRVIFITAYSQYAVQAFRHNAVDYLLKPVIAQELIAAVNKLKERVQAEPLAREALQTNSVGKIIANFQHEIIHIETDRIIRMEADSNYTHIYLTNNSKIISSKTLKEYEDILCPGNFYRVHKAHIVNIKQVSKYVRGDNAYLVMKDNSRIEVSRRKKTDFLLHFYKRRGI